MTEGIKYIGSKRKLLNHIMDVVLSLEDVNVVFDGFAGTTRVGQIAKSNGLKIISNDLSHYSYVFGKCYLESSSRDIKEAERLINHFNSLSNTEEGFITNNYSGGAVSKGKENPIMYWQRKNTLKADFIRRQIEHFSDGGVYYILLTSLILALDRVDNTVGVQQAFLKNKWCKRSYDDLILRLPLFPKGPKGEVYKGNANDVVNNIEVDLAYYDPPYTAHNYLSYYHIWDTIVLNDEPEVSGIVNRRVGIKSSNYNRKAKALNSFEELISNTSSRYVLISYNNEGIIKYNDLINMCTEYGHVEVKEIDYKRHIMSQLIGEPGNSKNKEYLILIDKDIIPKCGQ